MLLHEINVPPQIIEDFALQSGWFHLQKKKKKSIFLLEKSLALFFPDFIFEKKMQGVIVPCCRREPGISCRG